MTGQTICGRQVYELHEAGLGLFAVLAKLLRDIREALFPWRSRSLIIIIQPLHMSSQPFGTGLIESSRVIPRIRSTCSYLGGCPVNHHRSLDSCSTHRDDITRRRQSSLRYTIVYPPNDASHLPRTTSTEAVALVILRFPIVSWSLDWNRAIVG